MTAPATVRVHGPAELVSMVPYLLGFHPSESLVVVGMDDKRVLLTARVDLSELRDPKTLTGTMDSLSRGGATKIIAALYHQWGRHRLDGASYLPYVWMNEALGIQAKRVGIEVSDVLLVSHGRWWSYACTDAQCCPPEGRELPKETTAAEATAVAAGLVALDNREALAEMLVPRNQVPASVIANAEESQGFTPDLTTKRVIFAAARGEPAELDEDDYARFGVALRDHGIRDACWMAQDDGRIEGRQLWQELAVHLPSPYDAAPLFLFAWSVWRSGNGALAGIAAERALESDPAYSSADLLLAALRQGIDPIKMPKMRMPKGGAKAVLEF